MMYVKQHKYLFSKAGRYLKQRLIHKHFRIFPKQYDDTKDYIEKYFEINFTKFVA